MEEKAKESDQSMRKDEDSPLTLQNSAHFFGRGSATLFKTARITEEDGAVATRAPRARQGGADGILEGNSSAVGHQIQRREQEGYKIQI
ncbi:MAG: hypothetical protein GY816_01430 [Cytophagales bacterium]|nr:hypothetical protein [Cytophagales bacterium]